MSKFHIIKSSLQNFLFLLNILIIYITIVKFQLVFMLHYFNYSIIHKLIGQFLYYN